MILLFDISSSVRAENVGRDELGCEEGCPDGCEEGKPDG